MRNNDLIFDSSKKGKGNNDFHGTSKKKSEKKIPKIFGNPENPFYL